MDIQPHAADRQFVEKARAMPSPQPSPATRAERSERSREAILEAAITLFGERGYDGVSLDDITARSGAKRSLIIYYYNNKEELWRAAAEEVARTFNAAVQRRVSSLPPPNEGSSGRRHIEGWLDAFQEEPDFARFLIREGGALGPRLDFLVQHFGFARLEFASAAVRSAADSILRDAMFAIFLAVAALGPLLERALSRASGRSSPGIYPLSADNREQLIGILLGMLRLT
jgi:AcrR family transcriptional regulator